MKRLAFAIVGMLALSQLLLCGCGDRLLTVNIDALSFMDSTVVNQTYGVDPVIPAHGFVPVVFQAPPQRMNMAEGLSDLTDVQSVTLHLSSQFENSTGNAEVTVQVFISEKDVDPYTTTPYIEESILLNPATLDTLDANVLGSTELGKLLTGESVNVGIRSTFNSSGSSTNVTGVETLIRFTATVVGKRHMP